MQPKATVEQRPDGHVVLTKCRDCERLLTLPCRGENGESIDPNDFALKWADMLVCAQCDATRERERTERKQVGALNDRVKASGIPASFHGLRFEDMDKSDGRGSAVAAAWAWADIPADTGGGILLFGPPGTGKTRLCGTAVWRRLQRYPVTWCSVAHLIAQLQAAFNDSDRKVAAKALTGSGSLVLDDLDKVKPTEWALNQLFVAIDRRVSSNAPLFVTANVQPTALTEKFGSAITSRLLGYCRPFELGGRDRRLSLPQPQERA